MANEIKPAVEPRYHATEEENDKDLAEFQSKIEALIKEYRPVAFALGIVLGYDAPASIAQDGFYVAGRVCIMGDAIEAAKVIQRISEEHKAYVEFTTQSPTAKGH